MMTNTLMPTMKPSDADLVAESLDGNRDAFRQIVERYQNLICSVAYCATGNVSQSEDVAQETFLAAWKDLRLLREPQKLRAWLCSIVRGRVHKTFRRQQREPAHNAATLEDVAEAPASEALPSEQTISREEEVILWRSLEKIPELYREPLIFFYRENLSIEQVATALELSEDAVKQRLSRGRKLLQEEVHSFVEGALRRTAPGQAFSGAVLSALPLMASPAAATGLGMGAKGTAAAKSGFLAAWLLPFAGFLAGFAAQWVVISQTAPADKRWLKKLQLIGIWICMLGFPILGEVTARSLAQRYAWSAATLFITLAAFWCGWCLVLSTWFIVLFRRELAMRQQSEDRTDTMKPATRAFLIVGSHLMIFSWLIVRTWEAHDRVAAAVTTGAMVILGLWQLFNPRGTGVAATRATFAHLTLCCAAVITIINLRLDVWCANAYGVSMVEVHALLPFWSIPAFTLLLAVWVGVLLFLTGPGFSKKTLDLR